MPCPATRRAAARTLAQARQQLGLPQLQALRTVVEKRATFACTPDVRRPAAHVAPRLWACGDHVEGHTRHAGRRSTQRAGSGPGVLCGRHTAPAPTLGA